MSVSKEKLNARLRTARNHYRDLSGCLARPKGGVNGPRDFKRMLAGAYRACCYPASMAGA
jgi:hypothetical protein